MEFNLNYCFFSPLGVDTAVQEQKAEGYRPAFLDHFEKLEENQRNLEGNKKNKGNGIRNDPITQFSKNFLGPMDFDFVSMELSMI